ncbi:MAG: branched-chain amino acid transport system II carrier protein [Chlamydiia bacterium]|nr:branched-chain amino acid transport system II carrier protein [Chlamydiia bacterium]
MIGLLITGVGIPFLGLTAMNLYGGCYKKFFARIGAMPGFLMTVLIMGLIGPFGAMPRCIALSYSTTKFFIPGLSLPLFSLLSCGIIFLFTIRESRLIDILGKYLTPFLLASLLIIIIKGIAMSEAMPHLEQPLWTSFISGVTQGYFTMDLLGAFFFSSVVLVCLKDNMHPHDQNDVKKLVNLSVRASLLAAFLLGTIYLGFSLVAAYQSGSLHGIPADQLITQISLNVLGPYAGLIACAAVALACLTTAIALAAVSAEFIQHDLSNERVSYATGLFITLILTFGISTLNFSGILQLLAPILQVFYPAFIVLALCNFLHKLTGFPFVKVPFFATFALTLLLRFL